MSVPLPHAVAVALLALAVVALLLHRRWKSRCQARCQSYERALTLAQAEAIEPLARATCQAAVELVGARSAHCYLIEQAKTPLLRRAAAVVDPNASRPLPERMAPEEFAPVARVLACGEAATRHDPQARNAGHPADGDPRQEGAFWPAYGIDAILPAVGTNGEIAAVLLVGGGAAGPTTTAQCDLLARGMAIALRGIERHPASQPSIEQQLAATHGQLVEARTDLQAAHAQLAQAEYQATLGRLVAGIVHEANTPLGTIASSLDTLRRAMARFRPVVATQAAGGDAAADRALRAVDAQGEALDVMDASRQRLSDVLDSLGRFAALDRPETLSIDICTSIEDALALVASSASEGLRVTKDFPKVHPLIRCQPTKLNQVFLHLLENAVKAIDGEGEIRITVRSETGKTRVVIEDTGRGIAEAKLPQVLDFGFTIKTGGRMGLRMGLPASRQAIAELGGELVLQSTAGQGTRVVVELPVASY